jgi:hypothetical protein
VSLLDRPRGTFSDHIAGWGWRLPWTILPERCSADSQPIGKKTRADHWDCHK